MKKISRRSFITAMAAVSAAGVLAACGSSSSSTASSAVSSEATSSAASMDETGTHTVVDHGGNEVEVPNKVTRVVIDQIPILSTYMAYFEGSAPYIVGYCGSFKSVISDTVLKNIAPELLESSDTVYAQSDLNIEEIMKLNPDVILYNAGNSSHAEILKASGIPSIGFATVGASTEADPIERYEEWLKLLEQIFNEPGKTDAFVAAGDEIVTDVEARIAEIPQTDHRRRRFVLCGQYLSILILQSACHTGYFGCNQRHLCGCNSCYYPVLQYSGNAAHRLGLWPDFRLFYSENRRQE